MQSPGKILSKTQKLSINESVNLIIIERQKAEERAAKIMQEYITKIGNKLNDADSILGISTNSKEATESDYLLHKKSTLYTLNRLTNDNILELLSFTDEEMKKLELHPDSVERDKVIEHKIADLKAKLFELDLEYDKQKDMAMEINTLMSSLTSKFSKKKCNECLIETDIIISSKSPDNENEEFYKKQLAEFNQKREVELNRKRKYFHKQIAYTVLNQVLEVKIASNIPINNINLQFKEEHHCNMLNRLCN